MNAHGRGMKKDRHQGSPLGYLYTENSANSLHSDFEGSGYECSIIALCSMFSGTRFDFSGNLNHVFLLLNRGKDTFGDKMQSVFSQ